VIILRSRFASARSILYGRLDLVDFRNEENVFIHLGLCTRHAPKVQIKLF
jgi:hypothetical protein